MKRELAAGTLLALLIAGAWWNIRAVDRLTGDILAGLDTAQIPELVRRLHEAWCAQ